jgi:hypothetical protein
MVAALWKVYAGRNGIIGALTEDLIETSLESEGESRRSNAFQVPQALEDPALDDYADEMEVTIPRLARRLIRTTIVTVSVHAMRWDQEVMMATALSDKERALMDAYWRAANYLSVGQIYLYDNPLLKQPLKKEHIKPRLLGHWETTPGLNFIYVHLNWVINKDDLDMIYITGPGHGGPSLVANAYLTPAGHHDIGFAGVVVRFPSGKSSPWGCAL